MPGRQDTGDGSFSQICFELQTDRQNKVHEGKRDTTSSGVDGACVSHVHRPCPRGHGGSQVPWALAARYVTVTALAASRSPGGQHAEGEVTGDAFAPQAGDWGEGCPVTPSPCLGSPPPLCSAPGGPAAEGSPQGPWRSAALRTGGWRGIVVSVWTYIF